MQIIAKGGTVKIKLDQAEGRRMRDAAYIATRAAANLSDELKADALKGAACVILRFANEHTPELSKTKLDKQDGEAPATETKFEPPK